MDLKLLKNIPPWDWPEDAKSTFLGILGDERAGEADRLLAAELAGDCTVVDDEVAEALVATLRSGNESEDLRCAAAIALGPALEYSDTTGFGGADEELLSEETFLRIQRLLRELFLDSDVPKEVRRAILEASVRAPQDWHQEAVRAAYSENDDAWRTTAVFCMRFIRGFDDQIVDALDSEVPVTYYQAVCAAGNWAVDAAWSHIAALVASDHVEKPLRLAAIDAAASIRPHEARVVLGDLMDSDDEDIVDATYEALEMAEGSTELDEDEDSM